MNGILHVKISLPYSMSFLLFAILIFIYYFNFTPSLIYATYFHAVIIYFSLIAPHCFYGPQVIDLIMRKPGKITIIVDLL